MDITKSLNFYMTDPRRNEKLITGTAVILISTILTSLLIGFAGFMIVTGYAVRLLQNVRDGKEHPLPEWDRWSEDLNVGFKYTVAILVYVLPVLVLLIPVSLGAVMMDSSRSAPIVGLPLLILGMGLIFLYAIAIAVATPGITVAFARDEQIRSAFDFAAIWEWTHAHIGSVIVATLVYIAASFALGVLGSIVGMLLCIVGLIVTVPLATLLTTLVQYHLYGQLAHEFGSPVQGFVHMPPMLPAPTSPAAPEMPAEADARVTYVAPASPADFAADAVAPAQDAAPMDVGTVAITPDVTTPPDDLPALDPRDSAQL